MWRQFQLWLAHVVLPITQCVGAVRGHALSIPRTVVAGTTAHHWFCTSENRVRPHLTTATEIDTLQLQHFDQVQNCSPMQSSKFAKRGQAEDGPEKHGHHGMHILVTTPSHDYRMGLSVNHRRVMFCQASCSLHYGMHTLPYATHTQCVIHEVEDALGG
jgi:hypothetical protein